MGRLLAVVVVAWLLIGVVAAAQRGYFGDNADVSCKDVGDTGLTIVAVRSTTSASTPRWTARIPQPST